MPAVYPFRAVTYARVRDLSSFVAPPYDVLDRAGKDRLLARNPSNIVGIDLPHTPAKELGPAAAYAAAKTSLDRLLADGTLERSQTPLMFGYRQTFKDASGRACQRNGMACCVETVAFGPRAGGGILPHEETFSGPKEDRMALMNATRTQLSPIFGLHADDRGAATKLLATLMASRPADQVATTDDGTLHEVWTLREGADTAVIKAYSEALAGEDVFIADGHHRYSTGLNYLKSLEATGPVATDHPARRCMIVLVGMSDPGLVIWPTHRVLGGMKDYTFDAFLAASADRLRITPFPAGLAGIEAEMGRVAALGSENVFGLLDFATGRTAIATLAQSDPLAARFPDKPKAWRTLDVALIQEVIVKEICQPRLNGDEPVKWAFPHTIREVQEIGSGHETGAGGGRGFAQLAVIVRPTPLSAVRDVSRANQLMPQKSTFFYPKLATGLFMNPLT